MRSLTTLILLAPALLWLPTSLADDPSRNPKRGLVHTPNENWPDDDKIWSRAAEEDGVLSWYYNFGWEASESYASIPQSTLEFVPMMWGAGGNNGTDAYFAGNISAMIDSKKDGGGGRPITHVMTFSDPDAQHLSPKIAARSWVNNALPLQERGVKVGLPIVGDPYNWVTPFLANCSDILAAAGDKNKPSKRDGGDRDEPTPAAVETCKFDFIPITSYGNMTTLRNRVEEFAAA